jgi:hypothetical protein
LVTSSPDTGNNNLSTEENKNGSTPLQVHLDGKDAVLFKNAPRSQEK